MDVWRTSQPGAFVATYYRWAPCIAPALWLGVGLVDGFAARNGVPQVEGFSDSFSTTMVIVWVSVLVTLCYVAFVWAGRTRRLDEFRYLADGLVALDTSGSARVVGLDQLRLARNPRSRMLVLHTPRTRFIEPCRYYFYVDDWRDFARELESRKADSACHVEQAHRADAAS